MSKRRNGVILVGLVLSVSLFAASLTAVFITKYYNKVQFQAMGAICQDILKEQPEAAQSILQILKEHVSYTAQGAEENILLRLGYHESDFMQVTQQYSVTFALLGSAAAAGVFLITLRYWRKKTDLRISGLVDYLEKVNQGDRGLLLQSKEDEFSILQDEIYKTVTMLNQAKDAALKARNNFAGNLENIAHQLKTPITAISLSVQMLKKESSSEDTPRQIQRQLLRLTHLEEALLLLARIDSGTLPLEKKEVDVLTVLMLAADNLQESFEQAKVSVDIPELGEMKIMADLDWTMEAIMNLLKNCMEHTPPLRRLTLT